MLLISQVCCLFSQQGNLYQLHFKIVNKCKTISMHGLRMALICINSKTFALIHSQMNTVFDFVVVYLFAFLLK